MNSQTSRGIILRPQDADLALPAVTLEAAIEHLAPAVAEAKVNFRHVRAPATLLAYGKEWAAFERWCRAGGRVPLPASPETCALFVAHLGITRMPKGIEVALAAIAWHHRQGLADSPHRHPFVLDQLDALRRRKGTRPKRKRPLVVETLQQVVGAIDGDGAEGLRDRAILLVGFAGAFRRSELVGLNVEDIGLGPEGASVLLRRSKTDQHGAGAMVPVPFGETDESMCPVRALRAWLEAPVHGGRAFDDGDHPERQPVFCGLDRASHARASDRLTGHAIAHVVKARCKAAGIDPAEFSGHSMRAGLATSAARAGRSAWDIAAAGRWSDINTVFKYVREEQAFKTSAARGLL